MRTPIRRYWQPLAGAMADPRKFATSRRRALEMQRELDVVRDKAAVERRRAVPPASISSSPHQLPQMKKTWSPEKKIVLSTARPQLKSLAISSLHHTSGPASHTHRPHPLPRVSSRKQQNGRKTILIIPHLEPRPLSAFSRSSSEDVVAMDTDKQQLETPSLLDFVEGDEEWMEGLPCSMGVGEMEDGGRERSTVCCDGDQLSAPAVARENDIPELLAFSRGPVTMEDILSLQGTTLSSLPSHPLPPHPPLPPRSGVQYMASRASIHHFCTEPLTAELPAALQRVCLSRGSHDLSCDVIGRSHDQESGSDGWSAAGRRMEIAKDPSSLLWQPVPPKLSLRPRTVTFHLLRHATPHSPTLSLRGSATAAHVSNLNDVIREHNDVTGGSEAPLSPPSPVQEDIVPQKLVPLPSSPSPSPPTHKVEPSSLGAMAMREYDVIMREVANQRGSLLRKREQLVCLPQNQSSHLAQLPQGYVRRTSRERGGDDDRQMDTSLSLSSSRWRLHRQAIQGKRGGKRKRRSQVQTASALLRVKLARDALDASRGRQRSRRASYPMATSEAEFEKKARAGRHRRSFSLSPSPSSDFSTVMAKYGAPLTSDPWKWAQHLWWEVWFPEALQESRRALAQYYHGDQLRALIGSSIPEGGFGRESEDEGRGREEGAEREEEVIELETTSQCEGDLGSWEEECEEVEKRLEREGETAELLSQRAALLRKMGRLPESWRDVAESLSLSPSLPSALWTRHLLLLTTGSFSAAMADLQTIASSSLSSSILSLEGGAGLVFLSLLALALHYKKTCISTCISLLSQAIALCPGSADLLRERAGLHETAGDRNKALLDYTMVLSLLPTDPLTLERVGAHYLRERKWAEAEEHYSLLLLAQPGLTRVRVQRAQALTYLGRHSEALSDLCTSAHLSPEDPLPRLWRGCLLRGSAPHWALRDLSVALLLSPSPILTATVSPSSILTATVLLHRALVYVRLQCYQEALSDLTSAISLQPSLFPAHLFIGLLHLKFLDNPARAVRCLSSALRVQPTSPSALLARAEALRSLGKLGEAVRDYSRLIHLSPHCTTAYVLRGDLFRQLHNTASAREHALMVKKLTKNDEPSPVKALVAAFLHENEEAVSIVTALPPSPAHTLLRGKLLTKAGQYEEAIQVLGSPDCHMSNTDQSECKVVVGVAHLHAGQPGEVVKVLGEDVGQMPRLFQEIAHHIRGVANLILGRGKAGLADINRSLATNPQSYRPYLTRAAQFAREGRLAKAILNCNEAIALSPNSCRAFLYRGVVKCLSGNYQSAAVDLSHSVELAPAHVYIPLFSRAVVHQALGQEEKAFADYSGALDALPPLSPPLSPLALPLLVNRGLLALERRDTDTALHDLSLAQKLTADDPALPQALGLCLHRAGALSSSLSAYSAALSLEPVFLEALLGRGDVHMDLGARQEARQDYCKALALDSSCEAARISLAYLLQEEGRFMEAWHLLGEGGAPDGKMGPALLAARGIVSLQMGHFNGAILDLSHSLQLSPSPETLTNRGVVHCFLGDVTSAMQDYQRALTFDPKYSLAHFNIGNLLFSQHRFHDAIRSYSCALVGGSHDDMVLVNRGLAREIVGERERAMADLTAAIALNPHAAHAFFNRGNISRCHGDLQAAQRDYQSALRLLPGDWLSRYYLGQVTGQLGERAAATDIFQEAAIAELPLSQS